MTGSSLDAPWWKPILVQTASLVLAVTILFSIYWLARPIAILLAAIIVAVALAPIVTLLERRLPRTLAVISVYLGLALIILIGFLLIGFIVADEAEALIDNAPENRQELEDLINQHDPFGEDRIVNVLNNRGETFSGVTLRIPQLIVTTLLEIVIAIFLSVYWLLAEPKLRTYFLSMFADDARRHRTDVVIDEIGQKMGGYVRAITIDGIILTVITFIGLTIIGVRFPLVLAIISGLSVLVPILGPVIAAIPAILIAYVESPWLALIVLIFYIVVQQIESNIILPNIMKRQANIPPLLAVFAVFAGGSIGGILGALIAVPLAGGIRVLVTHALLPQIHSQGGNPLDVPDPDID